MYIYMICYYMSNQLSGVFRVSGLTFSFLKTDLFSLFFFLLEEPNVAQMQQRLKRCEKNEQEKQYPIIMGFYGILIR